MRTRLHTREVAAAITIGPEGVMNSMFAGATRLRDVTAWIHEFCRSRNSEP